MNKLRTHIVIHESFLLYFISKIVATLEEAEAPCYMKNASASLKSQMLPSSLPLPASFFKVLPLPQNFNRFRFQLPLPHLCCEYQLLKPFGLTRHGNRTQVYRLRGERSNQRTTRRFSSPCAYVTVNNIKMSCIMLINVNVLCFHFIRT